MGAKSPDSKLGELPQTQAIQKYKGRANCTAIKKKICYKTSFLKNVISMHLTTAWIRNKDTKKNC